MAQLTDKSENVLDGARILVLGIQIRISFDFTVSAGFSSPLRWARRRQRNAAPHHCPITEAMVFLALSMCGDFYVVSKMTGMGANATPLHDPHLAA